MNKKVNDCIVSKSNIPRSSMITFKLILVIADWLMV